LNGYNITVVWKNPTGSKSTGGTLWSQFLGTGATREDVPYDNWTFVGNFTYNETGYASIFINVPGIVPMGAPNGLAVFQYRDFYYTNLAQNAYAGIFHPTPAPTHSPTMTPTVSPTAYPTHVPTASPTAYPTHLPTFVPTGGPTKTPTKNPTHAPTRVPTSTPTQTPTVAVIIPSPVPSSSGSSESLLWKGNNKIYTSVVGAILFIGLSAGVVFFCGGRMKRKLQGQQRLQETAMTTGGATANKVVEIGAVE
jgi:hypothetical protein